MSATMTQIAKASNVSVSLVSRLMREDPSLRVSDETRKRVYAAKAKLEGVTAPVRDSGPLVFTASIAARFSGGSMDDPDNLHTNQLLQELELQLKERGHMLALSYTRLGQELDEIQQVIQPSHPAAGIIYIWQTIVPEVQQAIVDHKLPHVVCYPGGDYERLQTITTFKAASFRKLVDHLLGLGHQRIGYVGCVARRYPWFAEAMTYRRMPLEPADFCAIDGDSPMHAWSDWRAIGRERFAQLLDKRPDLTAVVVDNDYVALGVMDQLKARDIKVGEAFSVASYGNLEKPLGLDPVLTTIDEQLPLFVRRIVSSLLDQVNTPRTEPAHEQVFGELIVRQSTGPAPKHC